MKYPDKLRRDIRDFQKAVSGITPTTFEHLARAKRKPKNTSPVRWRIELRRRQNPGYYALLNEL